MGLNTENTAVPFGGKNDCATQRAPFKENTAYLILSEKEFMMNFRAENLKELLEILKKEGGAQVIGEIEKFEHGKFGWSKDREGNKIGL